MCTFRCVGICISLPRDLSPQLNLPASTDDGAHSSGHRSPSLLPPAAHMRRYMRLSDLSPASVAQGGDAASLGMKTLYPPPVWSLRSFIMPIPSP